MKSIRSVFIGQHREAEGLAPRIFDEDGEILPGKQGMRHRYVLGWDGGSRVHYAPLRRMVANHVGSNWDTVRARLIAKLGRDYRGRTAMEFIDDMVASQTTLDENGEVFALTSWSGLRPIARSGFRFYVHPTTRNLMRVPSTEPKWEHPTARANREAAECRRVLDDWNQLQQINGIWYHIKLGDIESKKLGKGSYATYELDAKDVVTGKNLEWVSPDTLRRIYGRFGVYGTSKRQLNHRELVRHGLIESAAA